MIGERLISLKFFIVIVRSLVCGITFSWADFQAGNEAYDRGDSVTAMREWRPLADQGYVLAQFNLGLLHDKGQGVPQDYVQARQWYQKAANQGYAAAQVNLGILYLLGRGGPEDYQLALYWLRLAAKQENPEALTQLGLMYERGNGVPQDYVQARKWYILGAARGDKLGAELRDALADRMTPAQVFQSQQRAREWKPKSK